MGISCVIVTHDNAGDIGRCLEALFAGDCPPAEVIVVDNASADRTTALVRSFPEVRLIENVTNEGFSRAMNQGIAVAQGEFILALNPDARLTGPALGRLRAAIEQSPFYGAAAPKLLRDPSIIDCAGIERVGSLYFVNRGEGQAADGKPFGHPRTVFGASAACALYRRQMLISIRVGEEIFDEHFFAYKDDVDVAWRAQTAGWLTVYVPDAVVYHPRRFHGYLPRPQDGIIRRYARQVVFSLSRRSDPYYRLVRALSFRNTIFLFIKNGRRWWQRERPLEVYLQVLFSGMVYLLCEPFVLVQAGALLAGWGRMRAKRRAFALREGAER